MPLSDVNMVWTYPGHGPQTMGNADPFEMKYVCNLKFILVQFLSILLSHQFYKYWEEVVKSIVN